MTSVGLVVPAYRPEPEVLVGYQEDLEEQVGGRIRVELDDPRSETVRALRAAPGTVHAADERRGKGAAITDGFEALADGSDVLAFADADGSTPAASIADVVETVAQGEAALAVGSRRHPEADIRSHQKVARRRMGDAFAWAAGRLLDVELHDYQCGAKAVSASTWRSVREHLYEPGFGWDIELIAMTAALDRRIEEVPVTWVDRPASTVSPLSTAVELGQALLLARHRARRLAGSPIHSALADPDETALVDRRGFDPADD